MKKILIIDDEKEVVNYLKRKLEKEDFEPLIAHDGYQALKVLAHQKVDAIITDSAMSEMDGYTFCKRLKELKSYSEVPILVCTAYPNEEREFRKLGIDDYIVKPFKFDYLFESLNRVLNQVSHKIKFKKVLIQANKTEGIKSAVQQMKEYGFHVDVEIVPENANIIEETIRHQSDIVVFNAIGAGKNPEIVITSLKSYVEFKDLKIVLYVNSDHLGDKRKNYEMYLEDLKERCRQAGGDGWIGVLSRDSFLNLMFEYCKG